MKRWIVALLTLAPLPVPAAEPQVVAPQAAAPEPENALKYLQAASKAFKPYAYIDKAGRLEPPAGEAAKRIVEENVAVFPLLERAVTLPLRFGQEGPDPTSAAMKVASGVRTLARFLVMRMQVQQEAGDAAGASRSGLLCVALGRKLQEDGGMITALSGYSIEAIGLRGVGDLAPRWDAAMLKEAARALGEAEAKRPDFALVLAADLELSLGMFRQMFQAQALAVNGYDQATQDRLLAALREVAEQDDATFERPFALTRNQDFHDYNPDTDEEQLAPPAVGADFDAHAWAEVMQKTLRPVKHNSLFHRTRIQAQVALLRTALAARAYQIEKKTPPASLQVLVPEYLPSLPADPFEIGAPLQLKSDAGGLRIYSVGPDGLDDGGQGIQNVGEDGKVAESKQVNQQSLGDMLAPPELLKP